MRCCTARGRKEEEALIQQPAKPYLEGPTLILRPPRGNEIDQIGVWLEDPATMQFLNLEEPVLVDPDPECLLQHFERIQLRLITAKIISFACAILSVITHPSSVKIKAQHLHSVKPVELVFAITQKTNGELIGVIVLRVSVLHQIGTIRTVIAPEKRRKHVGREAKCLILNYAFMELNLAKVCSNMVEGNIANQRVNEACGFKVEGVLKKHALINGHRCNVLCMALLCDEYMGQLSA